MRYVLPVVGVIILNVLFLPDTNQILGITKIASKLGKKTHKVSD